jgi:murein DD-endopeptidase MepM/ murein hydrolase activator NlpD
MQTFKFSQVLILAFLISSCVDQPPAPIEYGTSHSRNSDSQNGNEYYDASLKASSSPSKKRTIWGDKEYKEKDDKQGSAGITPSGKDIYHEVIEGETVDSIAKKYKISRDELIKINDLEAPYQLEELQLLLIPKNTVKVTKSTASSAPSSNANKVSKMPVGGRIVSNFGEKYMGAVNQGINISAPLDSDVALVSSGEVIHSGFDHKFGNLVIVRSNEGNIFEAYAHLSDLKHKVGVNISAGQIVGHVGTSGKVTKPQLHFAVRRGKIPIDPVEYVKN